MQRPVRRRIRRQKHRRTRRGTRAARPSNHLLGSLTNRWKEFLKQLRYCRAGLTEPAVHDLRVAIRRLVAAVDLLSTIFPTEQLITARQHLKRLLKHVSPLRDTQVQRVAVKKLSQEFPDLESFSTVLLLREQRGLNRISRRLGRLPARSIQRALFTTARSLERSMRDPAVKEAVRLSLQGALAAAFIRLVELRRKIDPSDPTTIHRLRVAFKKFRYTTEILRPDIEKAHHKAMNDYQTSLGDIRDRELLVESIEGFRARSSLRPRPGMPGQIIPAGNLVRIQRRLRRQHSVLVRKFIRSVDGFYRFYSPGTETS